MTEPLDGSREHEIHRPQAQDGKGVRGKDDDRRPHVRQDRHDRAGRRPRGDRGGRRWREAAVDQGWVPVEVLANVHQEFLLAGLGALFDDGKHQLLLAHARDVFNLQRLAHLDELGNVLGFQFRQVHLGSAL